MFKRFRFFILLIVLFAFSLPLFAEPDNGEFVATKEEPSPANIYIQLEPLKLQMPLFLAGDVRGAMTSVGFGINGEFGYNLSGWLMGLNLGYSRYGAGVEAFSLMNRFENINLGFYVSRAITSNTIKRMPYWLGFKPTFGLGVEFLQTEYYPSVQDKNNDNARFVNFGDVMVAFYHFAFELDFYPWEDYIIPYVGIDLDLFRDDLGTAMASSLKIGIRSYPFSGLNKSGIDLGMGSSKFTPNSDGINDIATLYPKVDGIEADTVDNWKLDILDSNGKVVKTFSGLGLPPKSIEWDGIGDDKSKAKPNSTYKANLEVALKDGKNYKANKLVNTGSDEDLRAKPNVNLAVDNKDFTPNGDGKNDTLEIAISGKNISSKDVDSWTYTIYSPDGKPFKTFSGKGMPPKKITWDGKGDNGKLAKPNTTYKSGLSVALKDGTKQKDNKDINVGNFIDPNLKVKLDLAVNDKSFTPDGDGDNDSVDIDILSENIDPNGVKKWTYSIYTPDGKLFKTFSGKGMPPKKITWDGKGDNGELAEMDSVYKSKLEVNMKNRDKLVSTSNIVTREEKITGPPSLKISMSPENFTPDGDGVNDEANISVVSKNIPKKSFKDWSLTILNPKGQQFKKIEGVGKPPKEIKWDGQSDNNTPMFSSSTYKAKMRVNLKNGRKLSANTDIITGILVERQKDGSLRIRVTSIYFDPSAATFNRITKAQQIANKLTLDQVARTVKKYPKYNIEIEGHANNVSGTQKENKEELYPLSQERAEAIAKELNSRGVALDRITAYGRGGDFPIVPRENRAEWWQNRRVEFVLRKK